MLLSIIFIVIGLYNVLSKNSSFLVKENSHPKLAEDLYRSYVRKTGFNHIAIGVIGVSANLLDDYWSHPTWIFLLIFLGFAGIFLVNLLILNKNYYGTYILRAPKEY